MKKTYYAPTLDAALLLTTDIMNTSGDNVRTLDMGDFSEGDSVPFGQIQANP